MADCAGSCLVFGELLVSGLLLGCYLLLGSAELQGCDHDYLIAAGALAPEVTDIHPVHFVPASRTCITLANRRARVSSCFAPSIQTAISFLCVNASFAQFAFAVLVFASAFFKTGGASTVRFSSPLSITTSTTSPGFTPAPWHKVLFTGIMCRPPHGISDERNG